MPRQFSLKPPPPPDGGVALAPRRELSVAALFAGIGGLEVGLASYGHHCSLLCENYEPAARVLASRFPGVDRHLDVRTLDALPPGVSLLTAGFPCQDLSQAGQTAGVSGARSGLVGEVFRLVEKARVPLVLLENVPFMLQLDRGEAMGRLVTEFERLGYRWAYRVVDTRAFGLPQRRRRVFFLAALQEDPADVLLGDDSGVVADDRRDGRSYGFYWTEGLRGVGWAVDAVPTLKGGSGVGIPSPPAIWLEDGQIVTPDIADAERLQGFEAGWTQSASEVGRASWRWKLVGNAVSVPAAAWIGERLAQPGSYDGSDDRSLGPEAKWPRAAWGGRGRRYAAEVSEYPRDVPITPIHEFLQFPTKPLSVRATAGFLSRASRGNLRLRPEFVAALQAHLEAGGTEAEARQEGAVVSNGLTSDSAAA